MSAVDEAEAVETAPKRRSRKPAADEAIVPDPPRDEVERIEPSPTGPITLSFGAEVEVVPLKLRETMKLLKIVTRGGAAILEQLMGELTMDDPEAFAQTLGALVLFSIPEAENEVCDFVRSMVLPVGFKDMASDARMSSLNDLALELLNPELEDAIAIIERVIRRESEDIRSLGKKIVAAFNLSKKVGEIPS